ncbi:MAG TPA: DNA-binding response regulator [Planctomycetaceae bacterium]|nr:DNA-binding response regulator [Planctomycetaceae bacterium]
MRVLVAEDDMHTREGLLELLQGEGMVAFGAPDGLAAWDMFQSRQPDLVCLDVMMPGISGYDVCRKIRAAGSTVPVLFITAKGQEVDKVVGLELGADDYIVKPFGVKEVMARIRAIARRCFSERHSGAEGDTLLQSEFVIADLAVHPGALRCRRADEVIELSKREVKILAELASRPGEVVSRQQLMNAVWGQEYQPSSRTLDQHISQLRKRIESNPSQPTIIKTVHGAGYRYDP